MSSVRTVDALGLFNELQARKNWPQGGPPVLFDVREKSEYDVRHVRTAHNVSVTDGGDLRAPAQCWWDKAVCVYDESGESLDDHPVVSALLRDDKAREVIVLSVGFADFCADFSFLCAKGGSRSAMKRLPSYPSCILPKLLYLGDIEDAAALPRLREHLNIKHAVTALADPPDSLKASVSEARVRHLWCNVRDVEGADIKEHFDASYAAIEKARAAGEAVFVHCSRGVSRSASLVIAYLMKREKMSAEEARDLVLSRRAIVLPNDGFWRCLLEFGKELAGTRSGVYVPAKTQRVEDMAFELPPEWAAEPTNTGATLAVERDGETLETFHVGDHEMYMFGRSLTCDFQLDHPSASRQHAVLVHHQNGGVYMVDLKSSHGTSVNGKRLVAHEPCRLREGAAVTFGASARQYRLGGCNRGGARGSASEALLEEAGPQLPFAAGLEMDEPALLEEAGSKRKMHPKKLAKKKRRWLAGPKARGKQSENERVAMMAGSGSGIMGPGFD
uniref:protein-tyrosine-phosphatase n=1 Tax=Coccolithus braarudii TaxID=221442 RepID=A0A7S0Q8H9_9EUKA|mmetsp:Transcript_5309/g.11666  ORF Transcript_5309/g.11666 Transcript_5309/m.11666 type:complete len:502 (+) Transcript_5309:31-1536(+)